MTAANRTHYWIQHDLTRGLSPWPNTLGKFCRPTTDPFGSMVRAQRLAAGLSLRQLAARASVSRSYLSDLERGQVAAPSQAVVGRISEALGG